LALGDRSYDVTYRALVMGILNRTPDSFFDKGLYFDFDEFLRRAEQQIDEGADLLDVGGVKAGPGPEVGEEEELERVVPAIAVARASYAAGAVVGNDISGFADPDYLPASSEAGASVVATHIRLQPRVPDPDPHYDDVVQTVRDFLADRALAAEKAGIPPQRIMIDAGLDLGKSEPQSLELLRRHDRLVDLGYVVLLSASNKRFLGHLLDLEVGDRRDASTAAHALGIALGCRVVRAHDVAGTRRVVDTMAALLEAEQR
jgi:dihydropteroate synthase